MLLRRSPHSVTSVAVALSLFVLVAAGCSSAKKDASSSTSAANKSATSSTAGGGCPQGSWPRNFQGTPTGTKDAAQSGVYVWADLAGLHLRVRDTAEKPAHYSGTVTGSKNLTVAKAIPADAGSVVLAGNKVTWDVQSSKDLKGFDLATTCQVLELNWVVQTTNGMVPADQIHTGSASMATSSPFTINRG